MVKRGSKLVDTRAAQKMVRELIRKRRSHGFPRKRSAGAGYSAAAIAVQLVKASSREVLLQMGDRLLNVPVQPEIAHTIANMVAGRAVVMAQSYSAPGGSGGRRTPHALIESIGRTGLDVEISPSGKVSAKVSAKPSVKPSRLIKNSIKQNKGERVDKVDVGRKLVVRRKDGSTVVHIEKLEVHITVVHADEMIVTENTTIAKVEEHEEEIVKAIACKEADEEIDETEDDTEGDDEDSEDKDDGENPENDGEELETDVEDTQTDVGAAKKKKAKK
jgi:hypothetical protein